MLASYFQTKYSNNLKPAFHQWCTDVCKQDNEMGKILLFIQATKAKVHTRPEHGNLSWPLNFFYQGQAKVLTYHKSGPLKVVRKSNFSAVSCGILRVGIH